MTEKTQTERLDELFYAKFGDDWRKDITLTLRADRFKWFVYLIEKGMEAAKTEFKAANNGVLDMTDVASLGSWAIDLEELVNRVQYVLTPATGKKIARK